MRPQPLGNGNVSPKEQFVLVVDEINLANLARVLGELVFLLEDREKTATLPYSGDQFSLPKNILIIGTMNTADRSIALIDAAIRRRFAFFRLAPDCPPIQRLPSTRLGRHAWPCRTQKGILVNPDNSEDNSSDLARNTHATLDGGIRVSLAVVRLNEARRQMDSGGIAPVWMPKSSGYLPNSVTVEDVFVVPVPQERVDEVLYQDKRGVLFLASFLTGIAALVLTFCSLHYVVDEKDYPRAGVLGAIALALWTCAVVVGRWKPKRQIVRVLAKKQQAKIRADVLSKESASRNLPSGWPSLSVDSNGNYDTPKVFLADLIRLKTEIHDWVSYDSITYCREAPSATESSKLLLKGADLAIGGKQRPRENREVIQSRLVALAQRHVSQEQLRDAGFVIWNKHNQGTRLTARMGVVAIGERSVFLLKSGIGVLTDESSVSAAIAAAVENGDLSVVSCVPVDAIAIGNELRITGWPLQSAQSLQQDTELTSAVVIGNPSATELALAICQILELPPLSKFVTDLCANGPKAYVPELRSALMSDTYRKLESLINRATAACE